MQVQFSEVFQDNGNGSFTPKHRVKIGGVSMGPGVSFSPGVAFSGVDIASYVGHALEVEQSADGLVEIKSIYN